MLHLPYRIGLYIPSTNYEHEVDPVEFTDRINRTKHLFGAWFGGGTNLNYAQGFWTSADKKTINENVVIVYSNTDLETLDKQVFNLFSYVHNCFITWKQYTISLEVNSELLIFDPDDSINEFVSALFSMGIPTHTGVLA